MRFIATLVSAALLCSEAGLAQQPAQPAATPQPAVTPPTVTIAQPATPAQPKIAGEIKINVIRGSGNQNVMGARTPTQPAVEVKDDAGNPVPGAEVVFELPWAGPGGTFNDWLRTQTVRTNNDGQAYATGFAPNDQEGRFNIKVTASAANKTATALIPQSNTRGNYPGNASASSGGRSKWVWLGILGAGALGGGIYAATRNGGTTSSAATPISISAGQVSVAGPR